MNKLSLEIRAMASQEYAVEQIAKKLKITRAEAEYYVAEAGYRPRYDEPRAVETMRYQPEHGAVPVKPERTVSSAKPKTWKLTQEDLDRIAIYRSMGLNVTDIARKIGKHRDTVRNALKKIGGDTDEADRKQA